MGFADAYMRHRVSVRWLKTGYVYFQYINEYYHFLFNDLGMT